MYFLPLLFTKSPLLQNAGFERGVFFFQLDRTDLFSQPQGLALYCVGEVLHKIIEDFDVPFTTMLACSVLLEIM